eukprot:15266571-Ditylum_brightwellii.AAC.1
MASHEEASWIRTYLEVLLQGSELLEAILFIDLIGPGSHLHLLDVGHSIPGYVCKYVGVHYLSGLDANCPVVVDLGYSVQSAVH